MVKVNVILNYLPSVDNVKNGLKTKMKRNIKAGIWLCLVLLSYETVSSRNESGHEAKDKSGMYCGWRRLTHACLYILIVAKFHNIIL